MLYTGLGCVGGSGGGESSLLHSQYKTLQAGLTNRSPDKEPPHHPRHTHAHIFDSKGLVDSIKSK